MPLNTKGNNAAAPGKVEPNKEVKPDPPKPEIKPEDKKPTEKPEEVKKPPVKQVLEKPKLTEKKPVVKPPVDKPVEKPTPDKSKDAKKKSEDKIKKKEEEDIADFKDSLLKNMEESEDGDPTEKPNNKKTSMESKSSAGQGGSTPDAAFVNEIMSKIQSRVSQCWSIPIGAKGVDNIQVAIGITFSSNGDVLKVGVVDNMRYNTDLTYRVLADSAVRAVKECSPIPGLPADKYSDWKEVELNFNPKDML